MILQDLLHRQQTEPLFRDIDGDCYLADFMQQVQGWYQRLSQSPASSFALYHSHRREFSAALLASLFTGKPLYLPADLRLPLPHDCQPLGEWPNGWQASRSDRPLPSISLDPEQPRLFIYTSGSNGQPQVLAKNLRQLYREIHSLEQLWGQSLHGAQILGTVPHQHLYGLLFSVLWPLATGRTLVQLALNLPEAIQARLQQYRSVLISSPALLKRLPDYLDWSKAQPQQIFSSGSVLSLDTAQHCQRLLAQWPCDIYGSSETGGIAYRQTPDSAYQPLPQVELQLNAGLLSIRSPHLACASQWFDSQDRAELEPGPEGLRLRLLGRADRIIKFEDKRLSLTRIEQALMQSHWLNQARVLVLQGKRQQLLAFIEPSPAARKQGLTGSALNRQLRQELTDRLDAFAIPRQFRQLDVWPVNVLGKTTEQELIDLLPSRPLLPASQLLLQQPHLLEFELSLSPELQAFDGHFPGNPILPGVSQVDWALQLGTVLMPANARFQAVEQLKFQQILRPEHKVRLRLEWQPDKLRLQFQYQSEQGLHSQGRLQMRLS